MNQKEKIDILFREYEALRAEINTRIQSRFNVLAVTIALLAITANKESSLSPLLLLLVAVFVFVVWWRVRVWIIRCGNRVAEIENEINTFAGCDILKWENFIRKN
ncbi:hypothetical protein KA005_72110, partial [bacterium]|nr:hypothetical protein [bacterium]